MSRNVFKNFCSTLENLPPESNEFIENIVNYIIDHLRTRISSLEDIDYLFRYLLYAVYWGEEDYLRAATILSLARVDGSTTNLSDNQKTNVYVKIAQAYLKADDDVSADRFIKKAGDQVYRSGADIAWENQIQYKACYAQILDSKRKFFEASLRYIELAQLPLEKAEESDLITMLERATKCIILAPAGPQRQRVMGTLYRDVRIQSINMHCFSMLERMYTERFVSPTEATVFENLLAVHQRATGSDGTTLFGRAIIEHNIFAAARVYSTIKFGSLSKLLGIDPDRTEKIAVRMINENRLAASIDQVDNFLIFNQTSTNVIPTDLSTVPVSNINGVDSILSYDEKIKNICVNINTVIEKVAKSFPQIPVLTQEKLEIRQKQAQDEKERLKALEKDGHTKNSNGGSTSNVFYGSSSSHRSSGGNPSRGHPHINLPGMVE